MTRFATIHSVKKFLAILFSMSIAVLPAATDDGRTATCAADIANAIGGMRTNVRFSVRATVSIHPRMAILGIVDSTGSASLSDFHHNRFAGVLAGDLVQAEGFTKTSTNSLIPTAYCERISVLSHGTPPSPTDVTASDFHSGAFDHAYVRVRGVVRDVFVDEIDAEWLFLVVGSEHGTVFASFWIGENEGLDLAHLEGSEVAVSGLCRKQRVDRRLGSRHTLRRTLVSSGTKSIEVLKASPDDPFSVPELESEKELSPEEIVSSGCRRVAGRVIATWGGRHVLIEADGRNDAVQCDMKAGPPPECGSFIEAVGLPETDLFRINLAKATWRSANAPVAAQERPPEAVSAERLFMDENGKPAIQTRFHGRLVEVRGIVRSLPAAGNPEKRIYIEYGMFTLPIDVSLALPLGDGIAIGCEVSVVGVCVATTDIWNPHSPFPHIREIFVVPRSPADIAILRHPPWWTPQRLLGVLVSLMVLLVAILVWNLSLRRLAERRGRQLADEHIARAETDLKVLERTRLAVELHDSVAQNLTGVAMELETARQFLDGAHRELVSHLDIAWRTLKSCRDELRNCLWDLRSQALEEAEMETAIRRTLTPYVKGIALAIRFNVPRRIISDNTTHALLRIIRELVLNGIRHGGATTVRIAGDLEDGALRFSVKDNGCGFDPDDCPGVEDGHYGLQGIRERVRQLGGKMSIESSRGNGTKTVITIQVPRG